MGNSNSVSRTFENVKSQFDKAQVKLTRDLGKYDRRLDRIVQNQKEFIASSEDFFDGLINIVKMLIGLLDIVVDSADLVLILVPAGMIIFVISRLSSLI